MLRRRKYSFKEDHDLLRGCVPEERKIMACNTFAPTQDIHVQACYFEEAPLQTTDLKG